MESTERPAAEEWAEQLGSAYRTEVQYYRLWGRRNTVPIATWVIEGKSLPEVEAEIAERKTRGERLVGVLAPCQGPDWWHIGDTIVKEEWDTLNRETRDKLRLLFRGPYPFAVREDYPASVAFTPEEAIAAEASSRPTTYPYAVAMRATADSPITDAKAALMTVREASTLLGEPQSNIQGIYRLAGDLVVRAHRSLDDPVVLVVMRGAFQINPPGPMHGQPTQATITTYIIDARDGNGISTHVGNTEIVLP